MRLPPATATRRALAAFAIVCVGTACGSESHDVEPPELQTITHAFVAADGMTITVNFEGNPCATGKVTAAETTQVVTLSLRVQTHGGACSDVAVLGKAKVILGAPLGSRSLRDAATGDPIPTSASTK